MAWTLYSSRRTFAVIFLMPVIIYIIYTQYHKHFMETGISSKRAHNKNQINILCFGDSLTAGNTGRYGDGKVIYHPYSLSLEIQLNDKALKEGFGAKFVVHNKGLDGERAQLSMERRLPKLLKESSYKWVIILGGTNDLRKIFMKNPFQVEIRDKKVHLAIFNALQNLHHVVHKRGGKTVAVTIPGRLCELTTKCLKTKDTRLRINELLREFALKSKENVVLADLDKHMPLTAHGSQKYYADEVHFNADGYDKMGTFIYNTLVNVY